MRQENPPQETVVPFLEDVVDRRGAESYLSEAVTMSEHMLQAGWLAERDSVHSERALLRFGRHLDREARQ